MSQGFSARYVSGSCIDIEITNPDGSRAFASINVDDIPQLVDQLNSAFHACRDQQMSDYWDACSERESEERAEQEHIRQCETELEIAYDRAYGGEPF